MIDHGFDKLICVSYSDWEMSETKVKERENAKLKTKKAVCPWVEQSLSHKIKRGESWLPCRFVSFLSSFLISNFTDFSTKSLIDRDFRAT
jgi:hypothetical protein